jgi:thiol-disulfide isomerase/thioredoxin
LGNSWFISKYVFKKEFNLSQLNIQSMDQKSFDLHSHRGKPVVLNFWSTWCGPCVKELPVFDAAVRKYNDKIDFLFISDEPLEKITKFSATHKYQLNYMQSIKDFEEYGILGRPQTFFIDSEGRIISSHSGSLDSLTLNKKLDSLI